MLLSSVLSYQPRPPDHGSFRHHQRRPPAQQIGFVPPLFLSRLRRRRTGDHRDDGEILSVGSTEVDKSRHSREHRVFRKPPISLINSSERVFWASASIKSGRLFAATGRCCGGFWLWLAVSLVGHGSGGLRDGRRRFPGMLGEAFQVLGGGGEQELVVGAGEAPEPEAPEAHVAF